MTLEHLRKGQTITSPAQPIAALWLINYISSGERSFFTSLFPASPPVLLPPDPVRGLAATILPVRIPRGGGHRSVSLQQWTPETETPAQFLNHSWTEGRDGTTMHGSKHLYARTALCHGGGLVPPLAPCSSHWFWFWETCRGRLRERLRPPREHVE